MRFLLSSLFISYCNYAIKQGNLFRGTVNFLGADLLSRSAKVYLFLERSCAILSSLKIMIIFNNKSADFVLISDDVVLKICNHNFA